MISRNKDGTFKKGASSLYAPPPTFKRGDKINSWTILKLEGTNKHKRRLYRSRCNCGTIRIVEGVSLQSGRSKSCGCWQKAHPSNFVHGLHKTKEYQLWLAAKGRAKRKQLPFELQPKDIKIPAICPVFKTPIFKGNHKITNSSPSLDELIPGKGYTLKNTWVISNKANRLKSNCTLQELETLTAAIKRQISYAF